MSDKTIFFAPVYIGRIFIFLILTFSFLQQGNSQHLPGGVHGAEIWYISDTQDILNDTFQDHSDHPLLIEKCKDHEEPIISSLFNFNPTMASEELCLQFRAPLEALYNKSIFIVAEPEETDAYPLINSEIMGSYVQEVDGFIVKICS